MMRTHRQPTALRTASRLPDWALGREESGVREATQAELGRWDEGVSNTDPGAPLASMSQPYADSKKKTTKGPLAVENVSLVSCCDVNVEKMERALTFAVEERANVGAASDLKGHFRRSNRISRRLLETSGRGKLDKFHASKRLHEKF